MKKDIKYIKLINIKLTNKFILYMFNMYNKLCSIHV